jgi:long-chain acyl-CoA synthetase
MGRASRHYSRSMLSDIVVPGSTPQLKSKESDLFPLLEHSAAQWPGDTALVRGAQTFTFQQLKRAAEQLAAELVNSAIKPGTKVGLMCPNGPEYVIGSFALFLVDAIVVPIFPGLKEREIASLAGDLGLDAYCYSPQFANQIPQRLAGSLVSVDLQAGKLVLHFERSEQFDDNESNRQRLANLGAPLIRFTSGTTSKAKGVIIPQASMMEYTYRFASVYSIQKRDCVLNLLSMAHIFYQVTAGMLRGVKLVIEDASKIDAVLRAIRDHRVTHIEAAPSFYTMLLAEKNVCAEDFRPLKYITSCGAPLPDSVADSFRDRFGREIVQRYGLTETGPVLINTNEDPSKRGSLGVAAPGCEIRLKDESDTSADVGEIQVRCAGLFHGYYLPWTPREEVLDDGWFRTEDVARRDADGYYSMTGRTKTMINVGAVKVFPDELEAILLSHSAVKEALVFASPEPRFGEVPHAKVVLRSGSAVSARELLRYVNRDLGVFKSLRHIEVVEEIGKTHTGKVKRYEPEER